MLQEGMTRDHLWILCRVNINELNVLDFQVSSSSDGNAVNLQLPVKANVSVFLWVCVPCVYREEWYVADLSMHLIPSYSVAFGPSFLICKREEHLRPKIFKYLKYSSENKPYCFFQKNVYVYMFLSKNICIYVSFKRICMSCVLLRVVHIYTHVYEASRVCSHVSLENQRSTLSFCLNHLPH